MTQLIKITYIKCIHILWATSIGHNLPRATSNQPSIKAVASPGGRVEYCRATTTRDFRFTADVSFYFLLQLSSQLFLSHSCRTGRSFRNETTTWNINIPTYQPREHGVSLTRCTWAGFLPECNSSSCFTFTLELLYSYIVRAEDTVSRNVRFVFKKCVTIGDLTAVV